jgi:hypothetical protein
LAGRIRSVKKSNDLNGNGTHNLPSHYINVIIDDDKDDDDDDGKHVPSSENV